MKKRTKNPTPSKNTLMGQDRRELKKKESKIKNATEDPNADLKTLKVITQEGFGRKKGKGQKGNRHKKKPTMNLHYTQEVRRRTRPANIKHSEDPQEKVNKKCSRCSSSKEEIHPQEAKSIIT